MSLGARLGLAFMRTHFPVDVIAGAAAIALLLIKWDAIENWERLGYGIFVVLVIHQVEEYRFPGGFVWSLNMVMGSEEPERYPGNGLSATFVDVSTTIVWALVLFFWPSQGLVAFFVLFALIEVLVHLVFGVVSYRRYRSVGKTTIYFPGNLTAFFGFLPLGIAGLYLFITENLLTGGEWWILALIVLAFLAVWLGLPTILAARKDSPFVYSTPPVEGHYFHRYEQALRATQERTP